METTIRKCEWADFDELLKIAAQTYDETFRAMNTEANFEAYMRRAFNREKFMAEMADPGSSFYFIYADGRLAGYLKLNVGDAQSDLPGPDSLEIERIYVKQGFQGSGLGKTMLEFALNAARQAGKKFAWLGVWEKNEHAIGFYQKLGFRPAGRHEFVMGDDHQTDYIMRIDLDAG